MVPILARQAIIRKCDFPNAKMTGNYECAFALGLFAARLEMPEGIIGECSNLIELKNRLEDGIRNISTDKDKLKQLIKITVDYEPSEHMDETMSDLFKDGFNYNSVDL